MSEDMVKSQMNTGVKAQSKGGRFRPLNSGGLVGLLKGVRGVRLVLAVGIVHEGMHKVRGVECKKVKISAPVEKDVAGSEASLEASAQSVVVLNSG